MVQLLLTRAPEQNRALRGKLREDLETFSLPLLEAKPLQLDHDTRSLAMDLDRFDKIIFISKNAVLFGMPLLEQFWPQWPVKLDWFAVGGATARALREFEIEALYPTEASSEGLLELPALQAVRDEEVLIVRGVGGRETLKTGLLSRGAKVSYLEVYDRQVVDHPREALPQGDDVVALVYSGEAIIRLAELIGQAQTKYQLIVPSKRLQQLANQSGFDKVELAKNQEDHAMIEATNLVLRPLT